MTLLLNNMELKKQNKTLNGFEFIDKAIFIPEKGILVIGDLHLGYEQMLRELGILVPEMQPKQLLKSLKRIMFEITTKNYKLKKVIFLGDIKHFFGYEKSERFLFRDIVNFLLGYIKDKDIILIKGNHDKFDFAGKKMKNYYIVDDIAFVHGDVEFTPIFDEKIKTIIMGHIHPSVILSDKQNIKKEKFKCFLVGNYKRKRVIVLPSFFEIVEGTNVNDYNDEYEDYFSMLPKKAVVNFEVYAIGENNKFYNFGKIKDLK